MARMFQSDLTRGEDCFIYTTTLPPLIHLLRFRLVPRTLFFFPLAFSRHPLPHTALPCVVCNWLKLCLRKAKVLNASKLQPILLACHSLAQTSVIDLEQRSPWGQLPFSQVVVICPHYAVKCREDSHLYVFNLVKGNTMLVTY